MILEGIVTTVSAAGTVNIAPMGPSETSKQLERLGVAVYLVNPQGIAGILHAIRDVGDAVNRAPAAAALAAPGWKPLADGAKPVRRRQY